MKGIITILLVMVMCHLAQSQAMERAADLGKGINLSGWLEADWHGEAFPLSDTYTREDLAFFKSIGISSIRVPILFEWYCEEAKPFRLNETHPLFDRIDDLISWTRDLKMSLILVNHQGRELDNENFSSIQPFLAGMWQRITRKYLEADTDRVFFELRNEPNPNISNDNLKTVLTAIIDSIRQYDTDRTLIVGANWWNAGWSLLEMKPYEDTNLIYTFHSYDPFEFTHQGFSWSAVRGNYSFARNHGQIAEIRQSFMNVKEWSNRYKVPVFLGEFGASVYADPASRCKWIEAVGGILEEQGIPWCYWDPKNWEDGFGFFLHEELDEDNMLPCFAQSLGLGKSKVVEEWLSFEVEKTSSGEVRLDWKVGESSMPTYAVERSTTTSGRFEEVGLLKSKNRSYKIQSYTFRDRDALDDTEVYYRVRRVNPNGSADFSPVQSVDAQVDFDLELLSNPATDHCTIRGKQGSTFVVKNGEGTVISKGVLKYGTFKLNTSWYLPGVYLVSLQYEGNAVTKKLLKI